MADESSSSSLSANNKVSLLDLAAACLASAIVAADQITALASTNSDTDDDSNKKNARLKIDGSFVTDADMAAQQIIVDALHNKVSSEIRIVGEENEEEMRSRGITGHEERLEGIFQKAKQEIEIRYGNENNNNYTVGQLPLADSEGQCDTATIESEPPTAIEGDESPTNSVEKMQDYEIATQRISIFIDPLDATNSYAKGDYDPVSILVAIIVDQTPCFGVICKPFGYPGQPSVLDTGCMAVYGGTLLGAAYIAGAGSLSRSNAAKDPAKLPRAVISRSRSNGIQDFVTHLGEQGILHPEPLLVSGAGEKSLRIITRFQNEGLWFFPTAGTSLWDVAASDALLRATGGRLTDKYGNNMDYSKSRTEAENANGVVACYDQDLHATCIRIFSEGSWQ